MIDEAADQGRSDTRGSQRIGGKSLFGPLGFLYVASYCLLVLTMGWRGWWPGFLGCIVMASWPVVWAIGGALPQMIRRGWR